MSDAVPNAPSEQMPDPLVAGGPERVLQVERRDYTDLAPTDRPRGQSMRGFDPIYTDIVDYIVRCTHRIWDERDIGLIYTHYTHNAAVYYNLNAVYNREDIVLDTIQRLVSYPERRGMATQVIWGGNDVDGFYTSHLVTGSGRHTQTGHLGEPTGRRFVARGIADCMIFENKIYREWIVADNMAILTQLGLDTAAAATARARELLAAGQTGLDIGENRRLLGQTPPEATPDLSLAHTETETWCLGWLHRVWNHRMLGSIRDVYASNCMWHGPRMRELYGPAAVLHQTLALLGTMPDCAYIPQHVCSVPCEEGGEKVAIRWVMEGHHLGHGPILGAPSGARLFLLGITHLHVIDRRVVDEWTVWDEMALRTQVKLAELAAA